MCSDRTISFFFFNSMGRQIYKYENRVRISAVFYSIWQSSIIHYFLLDIKVSEDKRSVQPTSAFFLLTSQLGPVCSDSVLQ